METAPWNLSPPCASQPHRDDRPSLELRLGRMVPIVPHRWRCKASSISARTGWSQNSARSQDLSQLAAKLVGWEQSLGTRTGSRHVCPDQRPCAWLRPRQMLHSSSAQDSRAATVTATEEVVAVVTEVVVVVTMVVRASAGSTPYRRSRLGRDARSRHPMRRRSGSQGA